MKAKLVDTKPNVQLTMTQAEATMLKALVGGVCPKKGQDSASHMLQGVWDALDALNLSAWPKSYSDYFLPTGTE